ncbi:MAG: nucleotidyltransferase domain-containing protein [Thermodesulfobacteriota bacterium]
MRLLGMFKMKIKEEILKTLAALNPELQSRCKVKEIVVFGSLVRGEQTAASDVDLLVDFSEDAEPNEGEGFDAAAWEGAEA